MPESEMSSDSCCLTNDVPVQHGAALENRRVSKFVQLSLVRSPRTILRIRAADSFCHQVSVSLRLNRAYYVSSDLKAIQLRR